MKYYLAVVLSCLVSACTAVGTAAPSTSPAPVASDTAAIINAKNSSWNPHIHAEQLHYVIDDSAIVSISNDTSARAVPIESRTFYAVVIVDSDSMYSISIRVDSQIVNNRAIKLLRDSSAYAKSQIRFTRNGELRASTNPIQSCSKIPASSISRMSEIQISIPPKNTKIGDHWADSSAMITCHGKIPLKQQMVREYELLSFTTCREHSGVTIRKIVTSTFTAASTDTLNHLTASGSGTSTSMMCVDKSSSALLESSGESRLDLTVTTSRGIFPFTQKTVTHITEH